MASQPPTTPISAQLEKLLGPASQPQQMPLAPAAAAPSAAAPSAMADSSMPAFGMGPAGAGAGAGASGSGSGSDPADPSAALDNLFAARFTFQFDNLQHILRYMLGEMRTHKRAAAELERMNERLSALEGRDDATAQLHQQANVCRKHNTQVAATLTRMEERAAKESALVGRRLASLEVGADKRDAALAAHADQIESIVSAVRSGAAADAKGSMPPLSSLPSPALTNASSANGRRGVAEVEGLSTHISKFMLTHTHSASMLAEKVRALEDAEVNAKRVQEDLQAHISFLSNENKRLTEKMGRMEDDMDQLKMNPHLAADAAAAATATAAGQESQRISSSMAPSSHGPTGALPLPGANDSASVDIAVNRAATRDPQPRLTPSASAADLGRLSEADMATLQSRLENGLVHKVGVLRAELEQRWSVEKEAAREHRHAIIDAVQQAAESALEAKSAVSAAQQLADDAVASVVRAAEQGTGAALLQGSLDPNNLADSAAAGLMFAGQEQVTTVAAGGRTLSPPPPRGSRTPSDQSAAAAAAAAAAQASIGHIEKPRPLRASQAEFDRVRAMAELALRRTVQHSEVLALAESSPNFQRVGFGGGGGGVGGISSLEFDKLKASAANMGSRVLFVEDKVETLNALTLATRNQLSALAADVDNSPVVKSLSMRLFEQELKFAEVTDKVQLLAHLISKGGVPAGPTAADESAPHNRAARMTTGASKAHSSQAAHGRSLVSAMAAEDAVAARQGLGPLVRDDDTDNEDAAPSKQPAMPAAAAAAPTRPTQTRSPTVGEVTTAGYTDAVDTESATLGMVLRTGVNRGSTSVPGAGAGAGSGGGSGIGGDASSLDRMAKDLAVLGSMHEKLASAAALDAKLRQIEALEAKVASLVDLDLVERLTFIERRFNTELTFLRSHVNSKVDASSLKILLDKVELEQQHSAAALQASQAALAAAQVDVAHSRHAAHVSPTRGRAGRALGVDVGASTGAVADPSNSGPDDAHTPKGGASGGGKSDALSGLMSRSTARDSRSRVGSEIESRARDRKARMAHLLSMLEKKADAGAIRSLEEFVRSVDRHLRSMMQNQAAQIRQLHATGVAGGGGGGGGGGGSKFNARSGILTAPSIPRKMTVPGYDEPELHSSAASRAAARDGRSVPNGDGGDDDDDQAPLSDEDDLAGRRRPVNLIHPRHALLSDEGHVGGGMAAAAAADHEEDEARMGFRVGGTAGQVVALKQRCEELQGQIASLHAALARKQDRADGAPASISSRPISVGGGAMLLDPSSSSTMVTGVGGVALSLDGLTLNPHLSLLEHPHVSRLGARLSAVESDLTHAQGLVMYQSKQLRNHREWIAKHSREINAIREFVKHAQTNQAINAAAVGPATTAQPSGSQSARGSSGVDATSAAAAAASSSYPSPAVFQLLRQVESDISSLRRSLRNKVDFMDLGVVHPNDPSQALTAPTAPGVQYPHPTLEDLRRLLFYLTPQLQQQGGGGGGGGGGNIGAGAMFGAAAPGAFGYGHESKGSMLSSRGSAMPPIAGAADGHTHGPGHPDTWKCMACDRALDSLPVASRVNSRHTALTTSLSSIAPAGGLVGANTRRLIAATNPNALFNNPLSRGGSGTAVAMSAPVSALTPRPPGGATSGKEKRKGAGSSSNAAISAVAPQGDTPEARAARDHEAAVTAAAEKAMRKAEKKRIKAEGKARAAAAAAAASDTASSEAHPSPPVHPTHAAEEKKE